MQRCSHFSCPHPRTRRGSSSTFFFRERARIAKFPSYYFLLGALRSSFFSARVSPRDSSSFVLVLLEAALHCVCKCIYSQCTFLSPTFPARARAFYFDFRVQDFLRSSSFHQGKWANEKLHEKYKILIFQSTALCIVLSKHERDSIIDSGARQVALSSLILASTFTDLLTSIFSLYIAIPATQATLRPILARAALTQLPARCR